MTSPLPEETRPPDDAAPGEREVQARAELTRRELLKLLAASGAATVMASLPAIWISPQVEVGVLPAHAQSSPTPTPTAQARPGTPTQLVAAAVSSTEVSLAWKDNASNETGYKIERSADSITGYTEIANVVGSNVQTYQDTTVSGGNTYYYRVRAWNSTASSSYSNVAVATTP